VPQIARALGFAQSLCTGWNGTATYWWAAHHPEPAGRGEGALRGTAAAQHPRRLLAAYGNAGSDLPHLRMADRPLLVNGRRAARAAAARYGIPRASWR
jgi:phosphoserine phosphatase